jgi:hypothetical protein
MKMIPFKEAVEPLAVAVEKAKPDDLIEYYREVYPEAARPTHVEAKPFAEKVRALYPDEIVDLWNVVFSREEYMYYDEEEEALCERYHESSLT